MKLHKLRWFTSLQWKIDFILLNLKLVIDLSKELSKQFTFIRVMKCLVVTLLERFLGRGSYNAQTGKFLGKSGQVGQHPEC